MFDGRSMGSQESSVSRYVKAENTQHLNQVSVNQKTGRILLIWGRTLSNQKEKKGMQVNYLLSQVLYIEYSLYLS